MNDTVRVFRIFAMAAQLHAEVEDRVLQHTKRFVHPSEDLANVAIP